MENLIMSLGSIFFFILFAFLFFVFAVYLFSLFSKKKRENFTPGITVVIPAYNEEKNIGACIESILASDYSEKEVIIVDDGSTDATREIAKAFPVTLLIQDHLGKSEALNLGVKKAKYDFVVTIDADSILEKHCLKELVAPLKDASLGASTGTSKVINTDTIWGVFQNIEYHYNNLIRKSFSSVFKNGIWFFGALACYRKDALAKIGYFKKDTLTEDMDICLELYKAGYKTLHASAAICYTHVPTSFTELYRQRSRWWMGVLQALGKNKVKSRNPSINFLYINQYWWSFYAILSLPLIIYQVNFWLPHTTSFALFMYLFRWFTLVGPFYVLYMIPQWGINAYNIFGVMSGIMSAFLIIAAIYTFKDRLSVKNIFAIFFYFPYTIALNIIVASSLITQGFSKKRFFIR